MYFGLQDKKLIGVYSYHLQHFLCVVLELLLIVLKLLFKNQLVTTKELHQISYCHRAQWSDNLLQSGLWRSCQINICSMTAVFLQK